MDSSARRGRWVTGRRSPTSCSASPGRPTGLDEAPHLHFLRQRTSTEIEHTACPHDARHQVGRGCGTAVAEIRPQHRNAVEAFPLHDGKGKVVSGEKIPDGLELM